MNINLFDRTISFLSKSLDIMGHRHEVIASNIANQDTPNYSAKNVNFAKELDAVMNAQKTESISTTNPAHIKPGISYLCFHNNLAVDKYVYSGRYLAASHENH